MKTYGWRTGLTLALLTTALVLPAKAQLSVVTSGTTITQTYTYSGLADTGGGGDMSLVFNSFDPTLGTLQSVEIILNSNISGTATVTNSNPSNSVVVTALGITGDYFLADTVNTLEAKPNTENLGSPTPITVTPHGSYTSPTLSSSNTGGTGTATTDSGVITTSPTLTLYTGTGPTSTITLDLSSSNGLNFASTGGSPHESINSAGSGTAQVIYNYLAPVPEPRTTMAWILALGLGLMGARKYFRRTPVLVS